jgi:hypothetical protein
MLLQVAVWLALVLGGTPGDSPSVTCHVRDDAQGRTFMLERAPTDQNLWQLSMQDRESGTKWIRLALPGAGPVIANGVASVRYKNANGGRQVTLDVGKDHAALDVYVDHGLEVNIEPDLDPAVDRMNTNRPLTALDCTVVGRTGR